MVPPPVVAVVSAITSEALLVVDAIFIVVLVVVVTSVLFSISMCHVDHASSKHVQNVLTPIPKDRCGNILSNFKTVVVGTT
jgi:hypothetical protein